MYGEGGIYMDLDTVCIKPLDKLFEKNFVTCLEHTNETIYGLCTAIFMCTPQNAFITR